ncbi:GNAT family protein [Virgibacillus litoralis]|uniref:GNAT family N-acetyltransferase n=1 Tax=Virgibacillus litoralis TaxID=578221 RepID=UPI001AEA45FB|nr:GNAT family N-acetyltransferase [Virgibacillus litoralis]
MGVVQNMGPEGTIGKLEIYAKVKILKGENFVTIEETKALSAEEMIAFITNFIDDLELGEIPNVNIMVNSKFTEEIYELLQDNNFQFHDEMVTVYKELNEVVELESNFTFKSLHSISQHEFKEIWAESMTDSLNAPSSLTLDEQMKSLEIELGPDYKDSCLVAYEEERPVGVAIPHIEPGTLDEGRLFYFGLIPSERGKGKSMPLHKLALQLLKDEFNATCYIGGTSESNQPMLKTFMANGCHVIERNKVYKMIS